MELTGHQRQIVDETRSCVALGGPGTGKTTALIHKALRLAAKGEQVYVATYTLRAHQLMVAQLKLRLDGNLPDNLVVGTLRDFAQTQLEAADGAPLKVAAFSTVRRLLRQAMTATGFQGTFAEAEHIIRSFKARAKKPKENEPHYALLNAYKGLLEATGTVDRHDILRRHILALRDNKAKPCPARHLLIDNVQDVTRIQLLWLTEHIKQGVVITACGNDDQTEFARDGAVGGAAIRELTDAADNRQYPLPDAFRTPARLGAGLETVIRPVSHRLTKTTAWHGKGPGRLDQHVHKDVLAELTALVRQVKEANKRGPKVRIGVITRTDWQAIRIHRLLEKSGVVHACFAHSIWDNPGAIMVLDLLQLLLGQAKAEHLRNVLIGAGVNATAADTLFAAGLSAKGWFRSGGRLPDGVNLPQAALAEYAAVHRKLSGYHGLIAGREVAPQEAFKAAAHDLITAMNDEDRRNALVALDALLDLRGNLVEKLPQVRTRQQPTLDVRVAVAPVREVRNMEFDLVFMPFATDNNYPFRDYKVIGLDEDHERRLFYQAAARTRQALVFSAAGRFSAYVGEMRAAFDAAAQ